MKASNKAGLSVPWVTVRRLVADKWHCFPWEVDEAPLEEILIELKHMEIEARAEEWRRLHPSRQLTI